MRRWLLRIFGVLAVLVLLLAAAIAVIIWDPFQPADIRAMKGIRATIQTRGRLSADEKHQLLLQCKQVSDDYPNTRGGVISELMGATYLADADREGVMVKRLDKSIATTDLEVLEKSFYQHVGGLNKIKNLGPTLSKRLDENPDHPSAAGLTVRLAQMNFPEEGEEPSEIYLAIADRIRERYADQEGVLGFCEPFVQAYLHNTPWPRKLEPHLSAILKKNTHRSVRCTSQLALAQIAMVYGEERQDQAEMLFQDFLTEFDGKTEYRYQHIEQSLREMAEKQLVELRSRAAGKPAPPMEGIDLDGRSISLKDYRGKAVLITFWGTWCYPCMKLVPHERELVERYASRKFALLGVNCDDELDSAKSAAQANKMTWPSLRNEASDGSKITQEWKTLGFPTLYLIDHHGVIRRRWIGAPSLNLLDEATELLVSAADQNIPEADMGEVTKKLSEILGNEKRPSTSQANRATAIKANPRFKTFEADEKFGGGKYVVYSSAKQGETEKLPAILFLHGHGAQGTDGKRHVGQGLAVAIGAMSEELPMIAIFPQALEGENWQADTSGGRRALRILEEVQQEYPIDPDRIILSGFSMGGQGTWSLGAAHPTHWAAVVPIAHGWQTNEAEKLKDLPCRAFQSDSDEMIAASLTREMVSAIQAKGGKPLYTEFSGLTHAQTAKEAFLQQELIAWMLLQRRATQ